MPCFKGKCSGHCCQNVRVPGLKWEDLRAAYLAFIRGESHFTGPSGTFPAITDIFLLFPMLKPKGYDAEGNEVFSCAHYEQATGLCSIYEFRPTMCRMYPITKCAAPGCTIETAAP